MRDNPSSNKALSWTLGVLVLAIAIAMPVQARISVSGLGGDIEIEGFLSSEARANVGSGRTYLTQWIQRLQIEVNLGYTDVGMFDELSFTAIVRPEFDVAYYNGLGGGITREGGANSYYSTGNFNHFNDSVGFGGFDGAFAGVNGVDFLSTGGISKIVTHGFENPQWLQNNFEVIAARTGTVGGNFSEGNGVASGFPIFGTTGQQELRCRRCQNVDNSHLEVAMNNTDSSGELYPFRELYMDGIIGDFWIRLGKQQIVWGKTDFFRLQDQLNPVDFGQHFFFDSFEDIRIPQWMLSIQYKAGTIGPLTDNAFQFVWNFDEYKGVGLGNPSGAWAHPFSKIQSTFAGFNEYFSVEPCIGPAYTPRANAFAAVVGGGAAAVQTAINNNPNLRCGAGGPNDDRKPSGFGTLAGLAGGSARPDWSISNTEPAARWEFRFKAVRMAFTHHYGWNDIPVFAFDGVYVNNADISASDNRGTPDTLIFDLAAMTATGGAQGNIPVRLMTPQDAISAVAQGGSTAGLRAAAAAAQAQDNAELFYRTGALLGGPTSIRYKQAHTTGMAIDYFEPWSGLVFRIESSITLDQLVNNTREADWLDESDVMQWSIGLDRPTFIPWLNKDRTFFLSMQLFDTWYLDHEGDKNTGFLADEHNFIWTFFFLGNYMRDTLKPVGFVVWEEMANSWTAGLNLEWLIDNHWSVKGGFYTIWGGDNNYTHSAGPYTSFIRGMGDNTGDSRVGTFGTNNNYMYQNSPLGVAHEGIGSLRDNDELFLQLKYQF